MIMFYYHLWECGKMSKLLVSW